MPVWWSDPTNYHAYVLSLVSIVITLIAAIVGIAGYVVSEGVEGEPKLNT